MIARVLTEYDEDGTAPAPYIAIERAVEAYRMKYDATSPAIVKSDIHKIQVHYSSMKYKFGASCAGNNCAKQHYTDHSNIVCSC